ncbi:MAG: hypothetical protein SCARUB_04934 [Candidatus Scalindua rubra]|uniref:Uncharacterized protein n=1 Tax=Candidatus Scalindua rubra TaxID=1872076 RepID=A0A1E3X2T9_9BACT|nr:MAG: hypothetical protein SCARUB_04934 [Candidatus Scalindua rubra]
MSTGKIIGIVFWSIMFVALYDVPWVGPIIGIILISTEPLMLLVLISIVLNIPAWLCASVVVGCIIMREWRLMIASKVS